MDELVHVQLPAAPPFDYLRWVAYSRQVEQAMLTRAALADVVEATNAPFLTERMANLAAGLWIPQVLAQARTAGQAHRASVAPVIFGGARSLARAAEYVMECGRLRVDGEWEKELGVAVLAPELAELQRSVLEALKGVRERVLV
jgi:hypothetical protein